MRPVYHEGESEYVKASASAAKKPARNSAHKYKLMFFIIHLIDITEPKPFSEYHIGVYLSNNHKEQIFILIKQLHLKIKKAPLCEGLF